MFRRTSVAAVTVSCLLALTATASAFGPRRGRTPIDAAALTALPAAKVDKPLRAVRRVVWGKATPPRAWSTFTNRQLGRWQASWDTATGIPSRIFGEGIPAAGATANAAVAERIARSVLADHLALLAPGASISDFELVSNHFDGAIRSVGFYQRKDGRRVVGGQVSFRFKADRLFVIGSEALPNVSVAPKTTRRLASTQLRTTAIASLRNELALPLAPASQLGDEVVLPLVSDDAVLGYRVARPLTIDGSADGRYIGYVDVETGAVIAVQQLNSYATGTVLYHTVDRYPAKGRVARPAPRAHVNVNGAQQTTSPAGAVSWDSGDAEVLTAVSGDLASVINKATGNSVATGIYTLTPGGSLLWDASGSPLDDAQLNTYVATMIAKEYVRTHIDAQMPTLDDQMVVNVNIGQSCNAFFDGSSINFFQASDQCENTGLLQDVVYHEYGHRLHTAELIPGVGDFDGSFSEGASDFLAASITNDPGMGRGFFFFDTPLRDLDPVDSEWLWPQDIGEIHHTGLIFGGVFWDLRKALIAERGEAAAIALVNKLFLGTLRRSINIPSSLVEALAEDDDDGNLANGTPNECPIRAAFGRHGLRTASGTVIAPGQLTVKALAIGVHIEVTGLSERCPGDEAVGAELSWVPPYTGIPRPGTMAATPAGPNKYFAQLPLSPQESVYYKVRVKFGDGSTMTLADNLADAYYQLYQGETVKLYCTDFETTDPFAEGWTTGTDVAGAESPFAWGVPTAGATDPHVAYSGARILAMGLDSNYHPNQKAWLKTPPIDVGQYSDVRVHYRRWLAVEDSHFDTAMVTANDKKAWVNYTGDIGDASAIHHVDKEWRFHDVPLSGYFSGHTVTVGFEIDSDAGLELGGWHLDDVCIVANPYAICGDAVRTGTEQCDLGASNRNVPDVCRTDCRAPKCGDLIIDSSEECDEGAEGSALCSAQCKVIPPASDGCCQAGGGGTGFVTLGGLVGLVLLRRRRRRRYARMRWLVTLLVAVLASCGPTAPVVDDPIVEEDEGESETPDDEGDMPPPDNDDPVTLTPGCTARVNLAGFPAWLHFVRPNKPCDGVTGSGTDFNAIVELIRLIDSAPAGSRIDGHIYNITIDAVGEALLDAQIRGVDVRISTDGQIAASTDIVKTQYLDNLSGIVYCASSTTDSCVSSAENGISHTKLFVFSRATAPDQVASDNVVWFGSPNQTLTSGTRLYNNTVTLYGDAPLYGMLRDYLDDLRVQARTLDYYDPTSGRGHLLAAAADVYVSPEAQTDLIVNRLDDVTPDPTCSVRVMQASIRDSRMAVVDRLIAMSEGGCDVQIVADTFEPQARAALQAANIPMRQMMIHDKVFVVHGKYGAVHQYRVYTGSHNLSGSANSKYDEIFVKLAPEDEVSHPVYDEYMTHFEDAYSVGTPL